MAHSIYGVASTINAANYVLFLALEKVQQLGHPDVSTLNHIPIQAKLQITSIQFRQATRIYNEQLLELHRGQGMEIYWRDNFTCPTEYEYKRMTIRKTGGLFMLAIRLMKLFSDSDKDFSKLTAILGLYFQIRDDYCNLTSEEVSAEAKAVEPFEPREHLSDFDCFFLHSQYSESKSFCEDLTEGKFSFPIIHAVNNQKHDRQVLRKFVDLVC